MEKSRKHLKTNSIVILILTFATILNLLSALIELNRVAIPIDAPENTLIITKIIIIIVSTVILLPQIYIGIKGLKVAYKPDDSKSHIVVATILLVLTVLGTISPVVAVIKQQDVWENVRTLLYSLVEISVFYDFIKSAKAVANGK